MADEGVARARLAHVAAVGEGPAGGEPAEGAEAGVEDVEEDDVLRVLGAHRPRAEHGKAGLHEEDQVAALEEPRVVPAIQDERFNEA